MNKIKFNITDALNKKLEKSKNDIKNNNFNFRKFNNDFHIKRYKNHLKEANLTDLEVLSLKESILNRLSELYKSDLISKRLLLILTIFKYYNRVDMGKSRSLGKYIGASQTLHLMAQHHFEKDNCFVDYDYASGRKPRGNAIVLKINGEYLRDKLSGTHITYQDSDMLECLYNGNEDILHYYKIPDTPNEYIYAVAFDKYDTYFEKLNKLLNLSIYEEDNIDFEVCSFLNNPFLSHNQTLLLKKLDNFIEIV